MENLFFSEALSRKLEGVTACALSALEAPAGYGKTTAVRRLFRENDAAVSWYTSVEGIADNSFRWFIRQLGAVDETAARRLEDLGYLNRSNAEQAAGILAELRPTEPLTLVFDNFQYALSSWQPQVLDALAKCPQGGLRTVFISQNFGRLRDVLKALDIRYTRADESHIFAMLEEVPELQGELTAREREVAELAAKGLRNPEIAQALGISENTVKHHLKIAFQKMNIDRRSKLIDMLR